MTYINEYIIFKGGITNTNAILTTLFIFAVAATIVVLISSIVYWMFEQHSREMSITFSIMTTVSIVIAIVFYFSTFKTYYSVSTDILKDPVAMEQLTEKYEIIMLDKDYSSEYLKLLPK